MYLSPLYTHERNTIIVDKSSLSVYFASYVPSREPVHRARTTCSLPEEEFSVDTMESIVEKQRRLKNSLLLLAWLLDP